MGEIDKNIFLDKKSKKYYMDDFEENVLNCPIESWQLDEGTEQILVEINKNPLIQSLYSKRNPENPKNWTTQNDSYIKFAYAEELEMKLLKEFVPNTICIFNDALLGNSNCYFKFSYPRDNPNFHEREDDKFKLQCLVGEDYFRINHISIFFHCDQVELHSKFWAYLVKELGTMSV